MGDLQLPLVIAANNGNIGGGEVMQLSIAEAARTLGYDVRIACPETPDPLARAARDRGFSTMAIPGSSRAAYVANLARTLRGKQRGLLWANGLIPGLASAGIANRVVHLHRLPSTRFQQLSARLAVANARAVLVPSRFMAEQVSQWCPRVKVMPNWTQQLDVVSRDTSPTWRVGFLGRVTQDKGVHFLAQALEQLTTVEGRPVELLIGGERRFESGEDLVAHALERLGHRVRFLGWLEPSDFFRQVDVAVFPSIWPEAFGLVVTEAMASGTPFVITSAGAMQEVAGPDHPWVAAPEDSSGLASVISELLHRPKEAAKHAALARTRWEAMYSPQAGLSRLGDLLTELGERP
mgnify:CR=1 FL=1